MLVDTSVWIDHLRRANTDLEYLLGEGRVVTHPLVIGELACGSIGPRADVLRLIAELPGAVVASHEEALAFVERHRLSGSGLGWVDVHLLASAKVSRQSLWSADRRLRNAARKLGLTDPE